MIKSVLITVIFFIPLSLFSQKAKTENKNTSIKEQIILQTNTDFYLSGESILYKTICLNAKNKETITLSKIAYVDLINNENTSVLKHKQVINNGISYNDFFIPTNIETGSYKIIAYTKLTQSNNEYASRDIFILNPYLQLPEKYKENNNKAVINVLNYSEENENTSKIGLNKKEFKKREKVTINSNENFQGNFVINVIKIDSIPELQKSKNINSLIQIENYPTEDNDNTMLFPETRGEIFVGKITAKNNTDVLENKKIALSIPGENFDFKIATTDINGTFKFLLNSHNGEEAYFQVFEKNKENFKIELFNEPTIKIKKTEKELKINPNYANAFLKRSIANQIQNIYYHTKSDTVFAYKKSKPFYDGSDKEYLLKDYNPQNTVKEIFIEIIPEVYISKKEGKQTFSVNDYEVNNSNLYYNTLVLVDGFLLQDVDEILTFDPDYFTKINFVNKGYFLNKYMFNGVVNLTTKDYNYLPNTTQDYIIKKKLDRPQLNKKYYNVDYSKNHLETIPDYRYQLYWEPNVTEINTKKPFEFYTSDISGNFKIIIEGITTNGESMYIENYIKVK
jgi:hypothetical protein